MKDGFRKFFVALFALCVSVVTTVLVMIKGWGLEPKSWFWIIGVSLVGQIGVQMIVQLVKDD